MKTILSVVVAVLFAATAFAQNNSSVYLLGSSRTSDIWAITNWGAFASDSLAYAWSKNFDVSEYDSIDFWAKGTSSDGTAKWRATFYAGFGSTVSTAALDSIGAAADTTSVKLENMQFIGILPTHGAAVGAIAVEGSSAVTANRKDAKVNIYAVGHRRPYVGNR